MNSGNGHRNTEIIFGLNLNILIIDMVRNTCM